MSQILPHSAPSTVVDHDWPCMRCGYNLKTLKASALCPECGAPVAESLKAQPLALADPKWLERVRTGVLALAIGVVIYLVVARTGMLTLFCVKFGISVSFFSAALMEHLLWSTCVFTAAIFLRHGGAIPRWPGWWLFIVFVAHLCWIVNMIILHILDMASQSWPSHGRWMGMSMLVRSAIQFFPVLEIALVFQIVASLSLRMPARPMLVETRILRRYFCLLLLVPVLIDLWGSIQWNIQQYWMSSLQAIEVLSALDKTAKFLLWPLWLYFPVFLFRFGSHLRRASQFATNAAG